MARRTNLSPMALAAQLKTFTAKALSAHIHLKARASDAAGTNSAPTASAVVYKAVAAVTVTKGTPDELESI